MTYGAFSPGDFAAYETGPRNEKPISLPLLCGVTLIASASVGLWMLYAPGPTTPDVAAIRAPAPIQRDVAVETKSPAAIAPLRRYAGFLDPTYSGGTVPGTFAQSAPLRTSFLPLNRRTTDPLAAPTVELRTASREATDDTGAYEAASLEAASLEDALAKTEPQVVPPAPVVSEIQTDVPLPTPRPRFEDSPQGATAPVVAAPRRIARQTATDAVAPAAPATPGLFDKLFGKSQAPTRTPPSGTALAYAAPQDGLFGGLFSGRPAADPAAPDRYTAVYDISAHTVYLPDGTQLEAHSGLGEALDNPNGVHLRMRGATPPNLYELSPREALFHGVRALRLTPTGGTTFGRGGLLAHTYMLRGRSGESNGCVVFRNYEAFLRAYDTGQIRRLAVVAHRA